MKLRDTPVVRGLNRYKLNILFAAILLLVVAIIAYVGLRDQSVSSSTKADTVVQKNYARNNGITTDINDIAGTGRKQGFSSSAPITNKVGESKPQVQQATNPAAQQQLEQELRTSMRAPITQLTPQGGTSNSGGGSGGSASAPATSQGDSGLPKDDQGLTAEKRSFIKSQNNLANNVLSTSLSDPVAALVLAMGTKIPAQLDQEINSDLPGQIYGHVSRDVFDSRTHSKLLIPAGSNLVGSYDSAIAYGQERLLVAWKRVNLPNGQWIDIQGMGGADPLGAGFGDQVDNHYWRIFGATFLTSVLAAGPQLAQPQQSNALQAPGVGQTLAQSAGTQIANTGTMLLQKNINIQPTIHIRAGFEFTVEVNKDIVFDRDYTANKNKN